MRRLLVAATTLICLWCAPAAHAAATWQLADLRLGASTEYSQPVGPIGDIRFIAPNRGLMTVEGTSAVPKGIYVYDGRSWRALATVCGGAAQQARIAWASPTEFWVIADTNPTQGRVLTGFSACRFKDGELVASYAQPDTSPDPWFGFQAVACTDPANCWFGGNWRTTADDAPVDGVFHVRWDGTAMSTAYSTAGADAEFRRSVRAMTAMDGQVVEALDTADAFPFALARVTGGGFVLDPFTSTANQLFAADGDGPRAWFGGGSSSLSADPEEPVVELVTASGVQERRLAHPSITAADQIVAIAAVPGTTQAWVSLADRRRGPSVDGVARVALVDINAGVLRVETVPSAGAPRGSGTRLDCAAADDCWLGTAGGRLFHLTDGSAPEQDTEFPFTTTITRRPPDARSPQITPDTPPVDDSQLFAADPAQETKASDTTTPKTTKLKALIVKVRGTLRGRRTLVISFELRRRARIQILGTRKGKVVARSARKTLKPGRRKLTIRLNPRRFPTKFRFDVKDLDAPATTDTSADEGVVTTGAHFLPSGVTR